MKQLKGLIFCLLIQAIAFAQDAETDQLRQLYEKEKYNDIIDKAKSVTDWKAKSLYYIGMAYYKKADDNNALSYLEKAIAKGPVDADMHFYKGRILYFMHRYDEAIAAIDKAIEILPNESDFVGAKADALSAGGKEDSALVYYNKAIVLPGCKPITFLNLAETYLNMGQKENALRVYQSAITTLAQGSEEQQTAYYNSGLVYMQLEKFSDARGTFEKLLKAFPNDYRAMSKLIQTHHTLEEFEKVKPWKDILYKAHKNKELPEEMAKMFCFDQFVCEGKRIMAFEMFGDVNTKDYLFVKHHFYVLSDSSDILYEVRSESSAAVRMAGKDAKYVLCLVKNGGYFTYWTYVFNDESSYKDTKKAVIDILKGVSKPDASTTPKKD